jgi:hypothetical protein
VHRSSRSKFRGDVKQKNGPRRQSIRMAVTVRIGVGAPVQARDEPLRKHKEVSSGLLKQYTDSPGRTPGRNGKGFNPCAADTHEASVRVGIRCKHRLHRKDAS